MPKTPECLVIVRRGETELFERLKAEFARMSPGVRVIWDRRVRDRRVIIQDVEVERRQGERRAPLDATVWTRGYILARPSGPAKAMPTLACATSPAAARGAMGKGSATTSRTGRRPGATLRLAGRTP